MRVLIPGVSGLLGINLALLALQDHEVIGLDRGRLKSAPFRVVRSDFSANGSIGAILDSTEPDWLINCAAMANLEQCEKDPAGSRAMNTDLPGELAKACAARNIRFVHLSTDAVFDGTRRDAYTEGDEPNPQGVYTRTKLDGERAVLDANPDAIVARVNFFGWSLDGRRNLGEFFVSNLSEGRTVNGFTDVVFCPMFVKDTARILLEMLAKGLCGLYHVVGSEPMTKYRFGVEIARRFGLQEGLIKPGSVEWSGLTAKRSHNLWLSIHKLSTDLGYDIPAFSTGLDGFYTQYQQGYPQKIRSYQQ